MNKCSQLLFMKTRKMKIIYENNFVSKDPKFGFISPYDFFPLLNCPMLMIFAYCKPLCLFWMLKMVTCWQFCQKYRPHWCTSAGSGSSPKWCLMQLDDYFACLWSQFCHHHFWWSCAAGRTDFYGMNMIWVQNFPKCSRHL
jgi:hypothetical protein